MLKIISPHDFNCFKLPIFFTYRDKPSRMAQLLFIMPLKGYWEQSKSIKMNNESLSNRVIIGRHHFQRAFVNYKLTMTFATINIHSFYTSNKFMNHIYCAVFICCASKWNRRKIITYKILFLICIMDAIICHLCTVYVLLLMIKIVHIKLLFCGRYL